MFMTGMSKCLMFWAKHQFLPLQIQIGIEDLKDLQSFLLKSQEFLIIFLLYENMFDSFIDRNKYQDFAIIQTIIMVKSHFFENGNDLKIINNNIWFFNRDENFVFPKNLSIDAFWQSYAIKIAKKPFTSNQYILFALISFIEFHN